MTINQIFPNEILSYIGTFLDNPNAASKVCKLFKEIIAQGCYEQLYADYVKSSVLKQYNPNYKEEDFNNSADFKIATVQAIYQNAIADTVQGKNFISPDCLEKVVTDRLMEKNYLIFLEAASQALGQKARTEVRRFIQQFKNKESGWSQYGIAGIRQWMRTYSDLFSDVSLMVLAKENLEILPEEIAFFSQLKVLVLEKNQLVTLPESIGELSELTVLDLSDNHLSALPKSMGKLKKLVALDLTNNKNLTTLPNDLKNALPKWVVKESGLLFEDGTPIPVIKELGSDNNPATILEDHTAH